tara:strand:+ start:433 stop:597 length:165 start_codon:yes stop_codon:yes gene_type:complete
MSKNNKQEPHTENDLGPVDKQNKNSEITRLYQWKRRQYNFEDDYNLDEEQVAPI